MDSNDRARVQEARDELDAMLTADELRKVPVLVLANKQDLPRSLKPNEVADSMGLHKLSKRQWYIQPTCATNGDGLNEGLDWLATTLRNR